MTKTINVGIDEVGLGAWAGPIVFGAYLTSSERQQKRLIQLGVRDSKALIPERRKEIASKLTENYEILEISHHVINYQGYNVALQLGKSLIAAQILSNLSKLPNQVEIYIDGIGILPLHWLIAFLWQRKIIDDIQELSIYIIPDGDALIPEISAASIIAKVYRDELMTRYHQEKDNRFHFDINKGYGTADHAEALLQYGLIDIHRWEPILSYLKKRLSEEELVRYREQIERFKSNSDFSNLLLINESLLRHAFLDNLILESKMIAIKPRKAVYVLTCDLETINQAIYQLSHGTLSFDSVDVFLMLQKMFIFREQKAGLFIRKNSSTKYTIRISEQITRFRSKLKRIRLPEKDATGLLWEISKSEWMRLNETIKEIFKE